jgi:UbiD family decarboxylase
MWRAQHIGHHVTAWQNGGSSEMPIAVAIGWEPSLGFCAGSPVPKGVCEYDVMGAIRGEPVDLVKCETVDLYVPATAEIVIEGFLAARSQGPTTWKGPFAEFTGYVAGDARRSRPSASPPSPTATIRSCAAPSKARCRAARSRRTRMISSIMRSSTAWNVLDRAGVPGITDVWCPPVQAGINLNIRMKQSYRNQAKQAANAIWGSSAAHVRYKHITVRDHQQAADRRQQHAADDDAGQRLLHLRADAGRDRRRDQADAGRQAGHEDLPHPRFAGADDRVSVPMPSSMSRRM